MAIQKLTRLFVSDNSGAKVAMVIGYLGHVKPAVVGSVVTVTIKETGNQAKVKKGEICRALIVRTKRQWTRPDGRTIKFDDNAAVLLGPDHKAIGTRVFGPLPEELRGGWMRIVSLGTKIV